MKLQPTNLFSTLLVCLFLSSSAVLQAQPNAMNIFDFASPDTATWHIQNDGVMGGNSKGHLSFENDALHFSGELVTRGGGFSSALCEQALDLSNYSGVEIYVKGDGRSYEFALQDGSKNRGREIWWRAPFIPSDSWTWIKVPFSAMKATAHGEPIPSATLNLDTIKLSGFYIIDGKDGDFRVEVKMVRGY